jgi:restriction system protein
VKSGFLLKKRGVWFLTPEGENALKLGEEGLFKAADEAYRKWRLANPKTVDDAGAEPDAEAAEPAESLEPSLDVIQTNAMEGIKTAIRAKNPYEFQDLCAALLRGMGYYTPFVASRGRDGGIDILAYRDPLGTTSPRIKVQVKHRTDAAGAPEIRQLIGVLGSDGDVGIFIASGGFTSDANSAARNSRLHIELVDLDRVIELWQEFYPKMPDEDKQHLLLRPVYFHVAGE